MKAETWYPLLNFFRRPCPSKKWELCSTIELIQTRARNCFLQICLTNTQERGYFRPTATFAPLKTDALCWTPRYPASQHSKLLYRELWEETPHHKLDAVIPIPYLKIVGTHKANVINRVFPVLLNLNIRLQHYLHHILERFSVKIRSSANSYTPIHWRVKWK